MGLELLLIVESRGRVVTNKNGSQSGKEGERYAKGGLILYQLRNLPTCFSGGWLGPMQINSSRAGYARTLVGSKWR